MFQVKVFNSIGALRRVIPPSDLIYLHESGLKRQYRPRTSIKIICDVCGKALTVPTLEQTTCRAKSCKAKRQDKLTAIKKRISITPSLTL
jgi:hypothetical protein